MLGVCKKMPHLSLCAEKMPPSAVREQNGSLQAVQDFPGPQWCGGGSIALCSTRAVIPGLFVHTPMQTVSFLGRRAASYSAACGTVPGKQ